MNFADSVESLKAAADPTRLRLLTLLGSGEATVGELREALGQSQPRVSRHLKILSEAGLVDRFRDGKSVYYRLPADAGALAFVSVLVGRLDADDADLARDRERMDAVRRTRIRRVWNGPEALVSGAGRTELAPELAEGFQRLLGGRSLGRLLDIGVGTGTVLCHLAPLAEQAVGIDRSPVMRVVARTRVRNAGLAHCTVRQGDMHGLELDDSSFDTVLLDQVMSLTDQPDVALAEAARVLSPGGEIIVLDRPGGSWQAGLGDGGLAVTGRELLGEEGPHTELLRLEQTKGSAQHV